MQLRLRSADCDEAGDMTFSTLLCSRTLAGFGKSKCHNGEV